MAKITSKTLWPGLNKHMSQAYAISPGAWHTIAIDSAPMYAITGNMHLYVVFNEIKAPVGLAVASTIGTLHDVETGKDISEWLMAGFTVELFSLAKLAERIREESKE